MPAPDAGKSTGRCRRAGAGQLARTIAAAAVAACMAGGTEAEERLAGPIGAMLVRVVDGDTLVVEARVWIGQRIDTHVRLSGIDAPELRAGCPEEHNLAVLATNQLARLAEEGPLVLRDIRLGTYAGRVVARVENAAGLDLASELLSAGLAGLYSGRGPRPNWCAETPEETAASPG